MSRKSSSGSRFEGLPIDEEEDDDVFREGSSESSAEEMRLSREFYPMYVPGTPRGVSPLRIRPRLTRPCAPPVPPAPPTVMVGQRRMILARRSPTQQQGGAGTYQGSSSVRSRVHRPCAPPAPPVPPTPPTVMIGQRRMILARRSPTQQQQEEGGAATSQRSPSVRPKILGPIPDPSGLEFVWNHFRGEGFQESQDIYDLDPMFGEVSGPQDLPQTIEDDVEILRNVGYNIDYPDGKLGAGFYGEVYSGTYASESPQELPSRFAVKIVDFKEHSVFESEVNYTRERFETEKYILTSAHHRNVVTIRMIINMGEINSFPFNEDPDRSFLSPDRAYLIMDYAEGGPLDDWLFKHMNISPFQRFNLIKDLFAGMYYLHSQNIIHGDIHSGNVLMFLEDDQWVAKWADFGLGYVGKDKQYRFRRQEPIDLSSEFRSDIKGLSGVIATVLKDRNPRNELPEERELIEGVMEMIRFMKKSRSLDEVYEKFKHILEEEIVFEEQHY